LNEDQIFEFYCCDNILLNYDLDNEEILSGIVDGPKDGGVDAIYVIAAGQLVSNIEDFNPNGFRQNSDLELIIIQAKNQENFKETPINNLASSLPMLLDHNLEEGELQKAFSKDVIAAFRCFLDTLRAVAAKFPRVSISVFYCCKGAEPNAGTVAKARSLEHSLTQKGFKSVVVTFLGAQGLYDRSSIQKTYVGELQPFTTPISVGDAYVSLCTLRDYAKFISDDRGNLISRIFEANVRAYQGEVEINKEIASSLDDPSDGLDFWCLNNGITIVADKASLTSNKLMIENPLIVNGLQTSFEIHDFYSRMSLEDNRKILVRIVVENDIQKRDRVIRATNRQTSISNSSFRSTESVHKEIEHYFETIGYYYDRRKNFYKRMGKPADKIVSIDKLAQGVLSVLLQRPDAARARPTTSLKNEETYLKIFSGNKQLHPLEMYGKIAFMLDQVGRHFKSISNEVDRRYRNNLKFHVLMVLSWNLIGSRSTTVGAISAIKNSDLTSAVLQQSTNWVIGEFDKQGAEDKTAKDSKFTDHLKEHWALGSA
jgi:AIPR protein